MENTSNNSINFLFKCIGISLVIVSWKVDLVRQPTLEVAQTIFYTFVNNWILAMWYGLPIMVVMDSYSKLKQKFKDYITFKL